MSESKENHLTVVIPCFNEEEVLLETAKRVSEVLKGLIEEKKVSNLSKILFVDDGSVDKTWEIVEKLNKNSELISGLKLSSNKGHQTAVIAGLTEVDADCYITMDADLQDDINVIVDMVDLYLKGKDVVYGVREDRSIDSFFKRFSAQLFYKLFSMIGGKSVYNHADFRLMSKRAVEGLRLYQERNLYLRGIVPELGFEEAIVTYSRKKRFAGATKYPLKRMIALSLEAITSFSFVPLRLISLIGFLVFFVSAAMILYIFLIYFFTDKVLPGWASTVLPIYFIGGIQLLFLGVIGEYVGKIYMETKSRPRYFVDKFLK